MRARFILVIFMLAGFISCNNYNKPVNASIGETQVSATHKASAFTKQFTGVEKIVPYDSFASILTGFSGYDMNNDGIVEIHSLVPVGPASENILNAGDNLIIVLIESRLLQQGDIDIMPSLLTYRADLIRDGFKPRLISANVYAGEEHQDGRTLLAIREFFRAVKTRCDHEGADFKGAVLVGSFPEASIIRTQAWTKGGPDSSIDVNGTTYEDVAYITVIPELITKRAEIVLSDLDGNWENMYQKDAGQLQYLIAIPQNTSMTASPVPGDVIPISDYTQTPHEDAHMVEKGEYEDFFNLQDSTYTISGGNLVIGNAVDPEISQADQSLDNRLSQPEIIVSRINTRHVALGVNTNYRGDDGKGFFDANGVPQAVQSYRYERTMEYSETMERQLLVEYFQRNHLHRMGINIAERGAVVSYDLDGYSMRGGMRPVTDNFQHSTEHFEDASLIDVVSWLQTPAVLKGIMAHSSGFNSSFGTDYDYLELEALMGGAWRWGFRSIGGDPYLVPTFKVQEGRADFYLYRTAWGNGLLKGMGGSFYVHGGCESIMPNMNYDNHSYNNERYARQQNAESLMYFGNGLALIGRSKIYNDLPRGYADVLQAGKTFGDAWAEYYRLDGASPGLVPHVIERKRSYFWAVLGDWTLKLLYPQAYVPVEPDRYDGGGRNDTFATATEFKKMKSLTTSKFTVKGTIEDIHSSDTPVLARELYMPADIAGLTFDVPEDIDYFKIKLPAAVGEDGSRECKSLLAGTYTVPDPTYTQGYFKITATPTMVSKNLELRIYKPDGQVIKERVGRYIRIQCPHETFQDGVLVFSVHDPSGTNRYSLKLKYEHAKQRELNPNVNFLVDPDRIEGLIPEEQAPPIPIPPVLEIRTITK